MKTLIIGANGQIGKKLIAECLILGLDIRAMVRDASQLEKYRDMGVDAVLGDLEGDMREAFEDCEQVIFSAGSGSNTSPHKTLLVDLWGSMRAIDEAIQRKVKHFIMVSSLKSDDPMRGPEKIRHYLIARNRADSYLMNSSLSFTLLRPGRLLNENGTGAYSQQVDWSDTKNAKSVISRDDVVALLVSIMMRPHKENRVIDCVNGKVDLEEFLKTKFKMELMA